MSQLALGTVQFGLDYGISNTNGKISPVESLKILDYAERCSISLLDTAAAYGNSETVLGNILINKKRNSFKIVTKLPICKKSQMKVHINESIKKLKSDSIYGVLFHNFQALSSDFTKWDILVSLKSVGKISKIGISLYNPVEWLALKENNIVPDIVQLPFSIFDQRFRPFFSEMKTLGIEIHVRSIFLQGLFFRNPDDLPDFFLPVKEELYKLKKLSESSSSSITSLCMNFVKDFKEISYVVLGVDSLEQLKDNIKSFYNTDKGFNKIKTELLQINIQDERMILPYLWPIKS